jgi:hypothetical protein
VGRQLKQDKERINGKKGITISFDSVIASKLIDKASKENTTVSNIINHLCRTYIMSDVLFYAEMERLYSLEAENYKFLKQRAQEFKDTRSS